MAMVLLLPLLMAYSLIGETFHEAAGIAMLVLFVLHHIQNRGWYRGLQNGRYTALRIVSTITDLLLLAVMVLLPLSGIAMSKHLFVFLPRIGVSAQARVVHLLCAYWGFVLMSFHAGLHLDAPLKKLEQGKRTGTVWGLRIVGLAVMAYGVYAFYHRKLAEYLFLRTAFVFFDFSKPRIFFFADYAAMMVLFAGIGVIVRRRGTFIRK